MGYTASKINTQNTATPIPKRELFFNKRPGKQVNQKRSRVLIPAMDLSLTQKSISEINKQVAEMRSRWDARLSSPKLSVHGPMLSPKKSISQPDLNSPLSLESLIAYQKSRRMLAFTPPSSPSRNKEHASPIYSVMGPSGR